MTVDKPVCSEGKSILYFLKSRDGTTWKTSDTIEVELRLREIAKQVEAIRKMAQEVLHLNA